MSWSSQKKRGHFLYRLFSPKKTFLTFVFYLNVYYIEYAFRIFILLYIKKHYFIHFFCLFWKSRKAFSVSLSKVGVLLLEIFGCRPEIYWKMAVPNVFSNTFWILFCNEFKFLPQAKTNSDMKIKNFIHNTEPLNSTKSTMKTLEQLQRHHSDIFVLTLDTWTHKRLQNLKIKAWKSRTPFISNNTVRNFQSMKGPWNWIAFSYFFCYITWFDVTRHLRPCKRGLHVKSYCFCKTIA